MLKGKWKKNPSFFHVSDDSKQLSKKIFFGGGGGAIDGSLHLSTAAPKGAYAFKTNTNKEEIRLGPEAA